MTVHCVVAFSPGSDRPLNFQNSILKFNDIVKSSFADILALVLVHNDIVQSGLRRAAYRLVGRSPNQSLV